MLSLTNSQERSAIKTADKAPVSGWMITAALVAGLIGVGAGVGGFYRGASLLSSSRLGSAGWMTFGALSLIAGPAIGGGIYLKGKAPSDKQVDQEKQMSFLKQVGGALFLWALSL